MSALLATPTIATAYFSRDLRVLNLAGLYTTDPIDVIVTARDLAGRELLNGCNAAEAVTTAIDGRPSHSRIEWSMVVLAADLPIWEAAVRECGEVVSALEVEDAHAGEYGDVDLVDQPGDNRVLYWIQRATPRGLLVAA